MPLGEDVIAALVRAGRAEHPEVQCEDAAFAAFVAERAEDEGARGGDLLLAFGALRGDAAALAGLEEIVQGEVAIVHARLRPPFDPSEGAQLVRTHLLVAEGAPKLASYSGGGELRAWVRVVAARLFLNAKTRGPKEESVEDSILGAIAAKDDDPELAYFKKHYRDAVKAAFGASIAALGERERALLRFALLDRMNVDDIGQLYGVHRATAARWVASARDAVLRGTRDRLREQLGARELESVARLIGSQLDVSLSRVLGGS